MIYSRRDLSLLLPALLAANAAAQDKTQDKKLTAKAYNYDDLPVKKNGENRSRAILGGDTYNGYPIELHETELAPGLAPHPPHHHVHEEMLMIREGTLEVTMDGKTQKLGPGSVVYAASGIEHGWKNIGTDRARYFVLALGRDK